MNQNNTGADGTTRPIPDDVARSAFVSVPTAPPHRHQPPTAATSGITASHLAAMAASSNGYTPVDHNAAFMMSNAAATIAAVAASAVQQMTQANAAPGTAGAGAAGGPAATLPTSLYHAALHGNRSSLLPTAAGAQQVPPVPHAALLTALANAGQTAAVQAAIPPQPSAPGHAEAATATATSLLRPNAPVLSQPTSTLASPALLSDMQSWSLEQLDQHIALLQQMNQPIPHSVAILRAEAERKIKKKNDKRVANRKSASNSRARKKALVEEMTKTNARLKKQAMILALLPDLVMTTTTDGVITFCSAQAERILQYKTDDLVGAKLYNLLVPSSRHALKSLIEELVHPGKAKAARASAAAQARRGGNRKIANQNGADGGNAASKNAGENTNGNSNGSARDSSRTGGNSTDDTSGAAIVSEQSFPLSVVEVESKQQSQQQNQRASAESNENLDSSTSNSAGEDDGAVSSERPKKKSKKTRTGGDDYSSISTETKNQRANNNLDRNVRWHNERMMKEANKKSEADNGPKDDVTGASVTANNATARLSSLEHHPKDSRSKKLEEPAEYESPGDQSSSDDSLLAGVEEKKKGEDASDDSGYRESNDSREESSSSWSDTSRSNDHRKKPLAPTCRMCLIRDDLTTVWCEVTSSIRNKSAEEDGGEDKATNSKSTESSETSGAKMDQELLLCLRPIRNSTKKVDESFRFIPLSKQVSSAVPKKDNADAWVSTSSYSGETNKEDKANAEKTLTKTGLMNASSASAKQQEFYKKRPPKKRLLATSAETYKDSSNQNKRKKTESANQGPNASETEKSVVESLMLMNKSSQ